MTRPRVIVLVLLAIGVLAFDVWFFMEPSEAGQVSSRPKGPGSPPSERPSGSTNVAPSDQGRDWSALFSADDQGNAPWLSANPETHRRRNVPLSGSFSRNLMRTDRGVEPASSTASPRAEAQAPAAAQDHGTDCPGSLSIVMWYAQSPSAVIDGRVVRLGDSVGHCMVEAIYEDRVLLTPLGRPDAAVSLELRKPSSKGLSENK